MVNIFENYNIKNDATFRIGGTVKKVAFPETVDELIELLNSEEYDLTLGGCSNVLFSSNIINKNLILTKNVKNFEIIENRVKVSCGTRGPLAAKACKDKNLTGFEFLIGFPGTFGGMICMNASAHGQAISDTFIACRVYCLDNKKVVTLKKEEMDFTYRKSKISNGRYIVLDAQFELKEGIEEQINDVMERNIEFRKTRQPSLTYGNAGSIFKNPENDSAGRLLDLCNMKGQEEGGAKVFDKHANFIINYNNATSLDVLTLMYKMYSKVRENYRIELKPEIKNIFT